jgi:hypothetical protein
MPLMHLMEFSRSALWRTEALADIEDDEFVGADISGLRGVGKDAGGIRPSSPIQGIPVNFFPGPCLRACYQGSGSPEKR